jgi:hypothetical protein
MLLKMIISALIIPHTSSAQQLQIGPSYMIFGSWTVDVFCLHCVLLAFCTAYIMYCFQYVLFALCTACRPLEGLPHLVWIRPPLGPQRQTIPNGDVPLTYRMVRAHQVLLPFQQCTWNNSKFSAAALLLIHDQCVYSNLRLRCEGFVDCNLEGQPFC